MLWCSYFKSFIKSTMIFFYTKVTIFENLNLIRKIILSHLPPPLCNSPPPTLHHHNHPTTPTLPSPPLPTPTPPPPTLPPHPYPPYHHPPYHTHPYPPPPHHHPPYHYFIKLTIFFEMWKFHQKIEFCLYSLENSNSTREECSGTYMGYTNAFVWVMIFFLHQSDNF